VDKFSGRYSLMKSSTAFMIYAVFVLGAVSSCQSTSNKSKAESVAKVGDLYLYQDDIKGLVPEGTSKEDSVAIVRAYIDRWATQQLIIDAAMRNLSAGEQQLYDKLIQQYKTDLYSKAYLEEIVKQSIDTVISIKEMKDYYQLQKENFKLSGALARLRYIQLPEDHPKFELIKNKFYDTKKMDVKFWDTYQLQLKSYAMNDSVWVEVNQIYKRLPFITPDNRDQYIVSGKSSQYKDSTDVYLVRVLQVTNANDEPPFEFLKPTIKEIILNQRKLELIKKFENEITNDAIQKKKYEIFP
jgi:hypothetical protein